MPACPHIAWILGRRLLLQSSNCSHCTSCWGLPPRTLFTRFNATCCSLYTASLLSVQIVISCCFLSTVWCLFVTFRYLHQPLRNVFKWTLFEWLPAFRTLLIHAINSIASPTFPFRLSLRFGLSRSTTSILLLFVVHRFLGIGTLTIWSYFKFLTWFRLNGLVRRLMGWRFRSSSVLMHLWHLWFFLHHINRCKLHLWFT